MSGDHDALVRESSRAVPQDVKQIFCGALTLVLASQLVRVPGSHKQFAVKCGSGMGLVSSGEVSDSAFHWMVEETFLLQKSTRTTYEIFYYGRFKDDIFMIVGGNSGTRKELIAKMRSHSRFFKLQVDDVSGSGVEMLDITIQRVHPTGWSRLVTSLYIKPTSISRPLAGTSMHPPFVHEHWPLSQVQRIRKLCGDGNIEKLHLDRFRSRLLHGDCHQFVRNKFKPDTMCTTRSRKIEPSGSSLDSWLILPFHFKWARARIGSALSAHCDNFSSTMGNLGIPGFRIRLGWSLGGKHLYRIILGSAQGMSRPDVTD